MKTAADRRDAHSAASLAATATSQSPATPRTKFSPPKRKKRDETVKHISK